MLCSLNDAFYKPSSILTDYLEKQKNELSLAKKYEEKTSPDKEIIVAQTPQREEKISEIVRDITLNNIMKDVLASRKPQQDGQYDMNCNHFLYHLQTCKLCKLYTKNLYKKKNYGKQEGILNMFKGGCDNGDMMKMIINIVLIIIVVKIVFTLFN